MKRFSITLLPLLLTFTVLQAESAPMDEDVSSLLSNYDKETLTAISNELIKWQTMKMHRLNMNLLLPITIEPYRLEKLLDFRVTRVMRPFCIWQVLQTRKQGTTVWLPSRQKKRVSHF